jgi:hypothetical protein
MPSDQPVSQTMVEGPLCKVEYMSTLAVMQLAQWCAVGMYSLCRSKWWWLLWLCRL